VLSALLAIPEASRQAISLAARRRILAQHTAQHRAAELDAMLAAERAVAVKTRRLPAEAQ
jgi:hypothetical protein